MEETLIKKIQHLFGTNAYRLTLHAEQERDADAITSDEIEEALLYDTIKILEDYKNDPRGESFLMLGFTKENKPIHFVGAIHEDILIIITMYRPDPDLWINFRERRKTKL